MKEFDIDWLEGLVLEKIEVSKEQDEITFFATNGWKFSLYHEEEGGDSVVIEDICGDLNNLIPESDRDWYPILKAEKRISHEEGYRDYYDSRTWTFYELATRKGAVTIRWLGASNGQGWEEVDFAVQPPNCEKWYSRLFELPIEETQRGPDGVGSPIKFRRFESLKPELGHPSHLDLIHQGLLPIYPETDMLSTITTTFPGREALRALNWTSTEED